MSLGIVKLADDTYVEWSTVCDCPASHVMTRDEALGLAGGQERVERCDRNGTSFVDVAQSGPEYVAFNRAGPVDSCLTVTEMIEQYSRSPAPRKGADA